MALGRILAAPTSFGALPVVLLLALAATIVLSGPAVTPVVRSHEAEASNGTAGIALEPIATLGYVVYVFHPLPVPLPRVFPWPQPVSILVAVLIAVPAGALLVIGTRHAGMETIRPRPDQALYRGIYELIRHPQAVGEVGLRWSMAFLLNSPFLVLVSFVYVPIFLIMCRAEEQDLLLRYGDAYADYCRRTGAFLPRGCP